jgi:hypothetical protein
MCKSKDKVIDFWSYTYWCEGKPMTNEEYVRHIDSGGAEAEWHAGEKGNLPEGEGEDSEYDNSEEEEGDSADDSFIKGDDEEASEDNTEASEEEDEEKAFLNNVDKELKYKPKP